jgi:hypothetical protein
LRVAAVTISKDSKAWLSAVSPSGDLLPIVNHYVIGIDCGLRPVAPSGRPPSTSAVNEAIRAGWILRHTEARGNCGIDCMCHHVGEPRNRASWKAIRCRLADFMVRIAGDPAWHDVFEACQEMPVQAAVPKKGGIGPHKDSIAAWAAVACKAACSMSPATSSTAGAPSLVSTKPLPATACSIAASSFGTAAPTPLLSSPALPPPADEPPPLDEPQTLVASVPGCIAGPRAFAGFLQTCTPDQLQMMTASVTDFVAAEAKWRSEHPSQSAAAAQPRRKNAAFLVNYKYATGLAYNQWFKHAGHGLRAPHKDCSV